ncbi:MAG: hypothetical protein OEU55_09645, partial [Desulfobacterales bacterium]|nr:hypothetical protein [Desulfobacterales bacterium]
RFHHSAFGGKFVVTFGVGALAVKGVAAIETIYNIETVFFFLTLMVIVALGFIGWLIAKSRQCDDVKVMGGLGIRVPTVKL